MSLTQDSLGRRVVLSPQEALIAGGPAEEFEQRVQALLRDGYHDLLVDLRRVPRIDSRGVRALVRGHTTAQRLHATFGLACPGPHIRDVLRLAHLDTIFTIHDNFERARRKGIRWDRTWVVTGGAALCAALLWIGLRWPATLTITDTAVLDVGSPSASLALRPFAELGKLLAAALIGMLVTAVHAPAAPDRPTGRSMRHAQILLCISGAMMMIIIGNSLAPPLASPARPASSVSARRSKTPRT